MATNSSIDQQSYNDYSEADQYSDYMAGSSTYKQMEQDAYNRYNSMYQSDVNSINTQRVGTQNQYRNDITSAEAKGRQAQRDTTAAQQELGMDSRSGVAQDQKRDVYGATTGEVTGMIGDREQQYAEYDAKQQQSKTDNQAGYEKEKASIYDMYRQDLTTAKQMKQQEELQKQQEEALKKQQEALDNAANNKPTPPGDKKPYTFNEYGMAPVYRDSNGNLTFNPYASQSGNPAYWMSENGGLYSGSGSEQGGGTLSEAWFYDIYGNNGFVEA